MITLILTEQERDVIVDALDTHTDCRHKFWLKDAIEDVSDDFIDELRDKVDQA